MIDAAPLPVRVWDLPTRIFHWSLALCVVGSVVSAKIGGNAMVWHVRLGCVVLALVGFRILWGLLGGRWSRFSSFIYAPRTVLRYLRGQTQPGEHLEVGHNPLGSFSVFGLLGLLGLQLATGLVADDEIATTGPLNRFVSTGIANAASAWHEEVGKSLLIVLVIAHVAAVLYYLWRKQKNLIAPMVYGDAPLPAGTTASRDAAGTRLAALAIIGAAAALAWWIGSLGAP